MSETLVETPAKTSRRSRARAPKPETPATPARPDAITPAPAAQASLPFKLAKRLMAAGVKVELSADDSGAITGRLNSRWSIKAGSVPVVVALEKLAGALENGYILPPARDGSACDILAQEARPGVYVLEAVATPAPAKNAKPDAKPKTPARSILAVWTRGGSAPAQA